MPRAIGDGLRGCEALRRYARSERGCRGARGRGAGLWADCVSFPIYQRAAG
jgi:hypothetical protein